MNSQFSLIGLMVFSLFNPVSRIYKCFNPGGYFIVHPVFRIKSPVPWEDGSFKVRHYSQVTTVDRANAGDREIRTIWISRIFVIAIAQSNIIIRFFSGKIKTAFSVGYPDAQAGSGKRMEHDRIAFAHINIQK